jgi:hypothetical protein
MRKYKWHLLLCLKHIIKRSSSPKLTDQKIKDYCSDIISTCRNLNDENFAVFQQVSSVIHKVGEVDRDRLKTAAYIDDLKAKIYNP